MSPEAIIFSGEGPGRSGLSAAASLVGALAPSDLSPPIHIEGLPSCGKGQ